MRTGSAKCSTGWNGTCISRQEMNIVRVAGLALIGTTIAAVGLSAAPPAVMFWAWERPGDLRAAPAGAGVAFLAATVVLDAGSVRVVPRRQSLRTDPGTYRMAVVRIEARS